MIEETKKGLRCCAERHLIKSGLALAIYGKIGALTHGGKNGETYFGTTEALADLFGTSNKSIWRTLQWLCSVGFLEKINGTDGTEWQERAVMFQPKSYRWVDHDKEWVPKHPGECYQPAVMVWSDELADPLGRLLWKASNGNTRWFPNMLTCLRSGFPGMTDEQIAAEWRQFLSTLERPCVFKGQWQSARGKFLAFARHRKS
jgi:hypothetical protein